MFDESSGVVSTVRNAAMRLPRGCVPYLPCAVQTVLAAVHQAGVTASTHIDVYRSALL